MISSILKLFSVAVIISFVSCAESIECPPGAIVTTLDGGRLGNLAWEYASVWALAKYLPCNRTRYSTRLINRFLLKIFENLSLPAIEDLPSNCDCFSYGDVHKHNYHQSDFFYLERARLLTNCSENVVLSRYPMLIQQVWEHAAELRQELRYKKHFIHAAYETLGVAKEKYLANKPDDYDKLTYVGVHIRRTDYPSFLKIYNLPTVNIDYYRFCFEYFRRRTDLGKVIFIVVSDEPQWVKENIIADDVFLSTRGDIDNPGYDISLLSMCNHTIIDYGSYGYWAAMYAGGETLVSNISYSYASTVLSGYENWHFIYGKPDGSWDFL